MGEQAFLRRSFSSPSESSREAKEGDPCRVLGESISFGRFMSESLAWEKWSAFSHNRYLEEVERFSKPGSVAEKKAYFEAHYKKKAAERAAALKAANVDTTNVAESVTEEKNCDDSFMDSEVAKGESHVDEPVENNVPNTHIVTQASKNESISSVGRDKSGVSTSEGEDVVIQESIDLGNSNPVESNLSENNEEHNKNDSTVEENILNEEVAGQGIVSTSQKRMTNSSSKISSKQVTPVQNRSGNNLASRCKNFMQDLVAKKSPKSLHMSFHFSSRNGESSKISSPLRQKLMNSKDLTASLKVSTNTSISSRTKTKASVNGVLKRPSLNLKSEDRSIKPLFNKSVAGGIRADQERNSPSPDNSKSSDGKGSKLQSSIISSPFRFRSEERAAKRKEFYEKLEEKRNAEEAEKKHQQTRFQGKALQEVKKVQQSTSLKGKPNEDLRSGSQLPTGHIKKIPLKRPRSPILGRKATPSKISLDATSQPSTNTENSKCVKNNRTTVRSLASRFQKNACENASPNIQSSAVKR